MTRRPFDPTRAFGASASNEVRRGGRASENASQAASATNQGEQVLTPSLLSFTIETALDQAFPGKIKIRGEVSNFRERNHWYFAIKDAEASIACTCWASAARRQKLVMQDGVEVLITGKMAFYGPQGKLQIIVDKVEAVGRGALEAELAKNREMLRAKGYFDPANKKPLPVMPQSVAIVTSRSAAALQDVLDTAKRRWPGVKLSLFDVRVQGDQAAGEVARAIQTLSQYGHQAGIDAVIVTRGGGSMEDLWAFNELMVCEAIFACRLPIVAAIGHETDVTLGELCADARAATPTQAATLLVPEKDALTQQLHQTQDRLRLTITRRFQVAQQRLEACARHPVFKQPGQLVAQKVEALNRLDKQLQRALPGRLLHERQRIEHLTQRLQATTSRMGSDQSQLNTLEQRLHAAIKRRLEKAEAKLDSAQRTLSAISPDRVLSRGFSYTLDADGAVVREAKSLQSGDQLTTVLADGRVQSVVGLPGQQAVASPKPKASKPTTKAKKTGKKPLDSVPGLFGES